jgi:DNA topoisomerase VI subunit B
MPKKFGFQFSKKFVTKTIKESGFTILSAFPEFIDNSIDAGSKKIIITKTLQDLGEKGEKFFTYSIKDDGVGMTTEKLEQVVKTFGYEEEYSSDSISHYGVGFKYAILKLCKEGTTTIISIKNGIKSVVKVSNTYETNENENSYPQLTIHNGSETINS